MEKIFLVAAAFFFLGALSGSHAERKASAVELRLRRLQIAAWLHDVATRIRRPGRPPIDLHDSMYSASSRFKEHATEVPSLASISAVSAFLPAWTRTLHGRGR